MADLDDLNNPEDDATPDDPAFLTAYAPRVEHTPGDVWHHLDEDLREQFTAEYWPALRTDEQAAEAGQPAHAVAEVLNRWWPRAQVCAQPGGRARCERAYQEYLAGDLSGIPYDLDGTD